MLDFIPQGSLKPIISLFDCSEGDLFLSSMTGSIELGIVGRKDGLNSVTSLLLVANGPPLFIAKSYPKNPVKLDIEWRLEVSEPKMGSSGNDDNFGSAWFEEGAVWLKAQDRSFDDHSPTFFNMLDFTAYDYLNSTFEFENWRLLAKFGEDDREIFRKL